MQHSRAAKGRAAPDPAREFDSREQRREGRARTRNRIARMKWIAAITLFATAGLCCWAVQNHPYWFYQMTRWIVFVVCVWRGVSEWESRSILALLLIAVGVLFNPLAP